MPSQLTAQDMHLYRHPQIQTGRPYAFDVDDDGVLWEGSHDGLLTHDSRTGECKHVHVNALHHRVICSAICFDGKIVVLHQVADHLTAYDPVTQRARRHPLPGSAPNVWYGMIAAGKLLIFDRALDGGILIYDRLDAPPRKIPKGHPRDEFNSHRVLADGRVLLLITGANLQVLIFDPHREEFVERHEFPGMDNGPTGCVEHDGKLYFADSAGGQLLVYSLSGAKWLDPIPTPDYGKIYGFIGGGFQLGSRGYWCLSTYRFRSRLNPETGEIITPPGWDVGVDGHFPRFLDRFLTFDAATKKFDYLTVPQQPDGIPLACYSAVKGDKAFITGYVIPFGQEKKPTMTAGDWMVWQSFPAEVQPFDASVALSQDPREHLQREARSAPLSRGLFIAEETHTPPVKNMQGPSFEYPPGLEQALQRRVTATDAAAYWRDLAPLVVGTAKSEKGRVALVGWFIQHRLYYNPISTHYLGPIATLESGDSRCGQSVQVAQALFEALGIQSRFAALRNHTVGEVFYDGAWHAQDSLTFGGNQPERDGHVLSAEELKGDPYFADAWPLECFAYRPEQLRSADDFYVLGYTFGEWGSMPYYSGYYGAEWDYPPTLPLTLPAQRVDDDTIRLRWAESIKKGGGVVEYRVQVFEDRAMQNQVSETTLSTNSLSWRPPERNTMYHYTVSAVDAHRRLNANSWYPAQRGNFVLAPKQQYGWYGVI